MALLPALGPGSRITQRFGKAVSSVAYLEPEGWASSERFYWTKFPGSTYYPHHHPGTDYSAVQGTPFLAMEAGVVIFAGYRNSTSGNVVNVQINDFTVYGGNHFSKVLVTAGQKVVKGQTLALIGQTGKVTGPSTHAYLSMVERLSDGISRTMIYDLELFLPGGKFANDARIKPEAAPTTDVFLYHIVQIEKAGNLNLYLVGPNCGLTRRDTFFARASFAPVVRGVCGNRVYWRTTQGGYTGRSYICGLTNVGWHIARRYQRPNGTTYDVRISCIGN